MSNDFTANLFKLMEETFESPLGIYLDKDTSLFQTLETVSAQEASIPVGGKCASLAAQVAHVTSLSRPLNVSIHQTPLPWMGEIWRTVVLSRLKNGCLKDKLNTYQRINKLFHEYPTWNEDTIGGALPLWCYRLSS
jgi:hypothetical protein